MRTLLILTMALIATSAAGQIVPRPGTTFGYDSRGNSSTSTTIGNSTFTNTTNARRGTTGSETSTTIGGTTFTNGNVNGRTYNRTETTMAPYEPPQPQSRGPAYGTSRTLMPCFGLGCPR